MPKISQIPQDSAPTLTDSIPHLDQESTTTKRPTWQSILTLFFNNVPAGASIPTPDIQTDGWSTLGDVPDTVTYNGQRSYTLTFNGNDLTDTVSPGMRLKLIRTTAAPVSCTDLELSSTQYFNKTSPNKLTFTDDFTVGAWVKVESYGAAMSIISRYNGTSGWDFQLSNDGKVSLVGYNANAANLSYVQTLQSVPLNKWVHLAAQLDMSTFTATTTTSYVMMDGVNVPAQVARGGTNPTALVQAGDLEVGSRNGGLQPFDGKLAQVAVFNAKVTQATMRTYMSQTLAGTETSLASAYSFNNVLTDLNTTTPNNLTAQNLASAGASDSPFAGTWYTIPSATIEYGIITGASFSTDTTLTVQVPEGNAIPTNSGGVYFMYYSSQGKPYAFIGQKDKWRVQTFLKTTGGSFTVSSNATFGSFISGNLNITVPIGPWKVGTQLQVQSATTTAVWWNLTTSSITGLTAANGYNASQQLQFQVKAAAASSTYWQENVSNDILHFTQSTYTMYTLGATTSSGLEPDTGLCELYAEFNYV